MGNKYEIKLCSSCKEETVHRIFKRFGKANSGGKKSLRRTVIWCMACQKRIINNRRRK